MVCKVSFFLLEQMKLSIILTVYNKEAYLHRAFSALLCQEVVNREAFEVLVINDGSTDGSLTICEEYAKKDNRVRIITQTNQGLSMARNNGVDVAHGDYVWFVDADDIISSKAVNLICEAAKNNPDIIPIYAKTDGVDRVRNAVDINANTGVDILLGGNWEPCGVFNVFNRSFLKDNNLRFFPGIYHEDFEFTPRMLYCAKTVKVIPQTLYIVYRDPDSITQVPRPQRAFDYLIVAERLGDFVKSNCEEDTVIGNTIESCASVAINNAFNIICQNGKEEQAAFNKAFYEKHTTFIQSLKKGNLKKYQIEAFLFGVFPRHAVLIYNFLKGLS